VELIATKHGKRAKHSPRSPLGRVQGGSRSVLVGVGDPGVRVEVKTRKNAEGLGVASRTGPKLWTDHV
jgi:hypothetical protein